MAKYEIQVYFGTQDPRRFLGYYPLTDSSTFDHYVSLLKSKVPLWFDLITTDTSIHCKVDIDHEAKFNVVGNDKENFIFIVLTNPHSLKFLTDDEYRDTKSIDKFLETLDKVELAKLAGL